MPITLFMLDYLGYIIGERVKRARHIRGVQIRAGAVYIYINMYGGTCAIIVAHAKYM